VTKRLFCLLLFLVPGVASSESPTVDLRAEREALLAAEAAWLASSGDLEESLAFWDEEAVLLAAGVPLLRGNGIRTWEEQARALPGFDLTWQATSAYVAEAGDLGYTIGTYELSFEQDGAPVVDVGKYVTIWKKQADGSWKVLVDCFNSDAPPPDTAEGSPGRH